MAVDSSPQLRSKKKLIEGFIAQLNEKELGKLVDSEGNITVYDSNGNKLSIVDCWSEYVEQKYNHDLAQLVQSEGLNDSLTRKFMEKSFSAGEVSELGTDINDLMLYNKETTVFLSRVYLKSRKFSLFLQTQLDFA